MNLYHIKLTDDQKSALEHLFAQGITWSRTDLSEAWDELREQVREAAQHVAIINALQDSGCNCYRKTPTKYDPCRKFREGDVVDVIWAERGRTAFLYLEEGKTHGDGHWVVTADEDTSGRVNICYNGERCARVWYNMLELVTPVEELEPYTLSEGAGIIEVYNEKSEAVKAWFYNNVKEGVKALAEAEAERDRMNAEWRKEKK